MRKDSVRSLRCVNANVCHGLPAVQNIKESPTKEIEKRDPEIPFPCNVSVSNSNVELSVKRALLLLSSRSCEAHVDEMSTFRSLFFKCCDTKKVHHE